MILVKNVTCGLKGRLRRLALLTAASIAALAVAAASAQAAPRVVALTPFTANTLAALGVKPMAVGQTLGGNDRFVKSLRGVKRLTLAHPNGPNLEQLAVLNPQLVLSSSTWRKGAQAMRGLGIRVVESDPTTVAAIPRETEWIGALVGQQKRARRFAQQQRKHIAVAKRRARRHPTVLLVLGVGRTPFAFLPSSWGGDVIKQAGGRLLTAGLRGSGGFARISDEVVVKRNPDIIIAVPHGTPSNLSKIGAYLKKNPAWKNTKAARNGRIYISTDNSLLQPWPSAAKTIADVQKLYLKNR